LPRREVALARRYLEPITRLIVSLPPNRLDEADRLIDKWLNDEITREELIQRLKKLAGRRE